MKHLGHCHCGKIAYEVEADMQPATECNCSICASRGYLLWFVPGDKFQLKTSEQDMSHYTFNSHHIKHYFCSRCGSATFGMAADKQGKPMVAVNIRCLDGIDLAAVERKPFDGKRL
jgi:hypothetical protein